jgi:hypothetical protein
MSEIHSYPSIYNLGHKAIADLLKGLVIVEEKVDGSQISFGKRDGKLFARSKGATLNLVAPDGMFSEACAVINSLRDKLPNNMVFRGEYLRRPHHNVLTYDRTPDNHIIIFDVENSGEQDFFSPEAKRIAAEGIGLECVPVLYRGIVDSLEKLRELLETPSILGGQKIEGVVIKPESYDLYGRDKKVLMGKYVSESFKEVHARTWKQEHGTKSNGEILQVLGDALATPARWQKAVIHLREEGKIADDPRDIGLLIPAIQEDVLKECSELIREKLFSWAWPQLKRSVTRGMPEWYKSQLVKAQFETVETCK